MAIILKISFRFVSRPRSIYYISKPRENRESIRQISDLSAQLMIELRLDEEFLASSYIHILTQELQFILINSESVESAVKTGNLHFFLNILWYRTSSLLSP